MSQERAGRNNALRKLSLAMGVLVGFFGMEHGLFEILQGNIAPLSVDINAIGPAQRFWEYGTERAFTTIPNFLMTGIVAMFVGLLVILWSVFFLHKQFGAWIFLFLSAGMFLVGGGIAPLTMALCTAVTAGRINKPLTWWRGRLPLKLRSVLARLWPVSLVVLISWSLVMVEIAIFGYPLLFLFNAEILSSILWVAAYCFLGVLLFTMLSAFAYDVRKKTEAAQTPAGKEKL